jgi:hypothetical protein
LRLFSQTRIARHFAFEVLFYKKISPVLDFCLVRLVNELVLLTLGSRAEMGAPRRLTARAAGTGSYSADGASSKAKALTIKKKLSSQEILPVKHKTSMPAPAPSRRDS